MTILSTDLVKQFVESTHDETETKEPSRFYGTASVRPDGIYVILDGSTIPTPVSMATDAQTGDRVLVEIVNHQARVIQNINKSNSDIVAGRIEHDETGVFKELRVGKEYVDTLIASDITADSIVADRAKIETLEAGKANITDLNAVKADIETLETTKLSAEDADIRYLNVDFSKIDKAWLQEFYAQSGIIKDLVIGESTVTGHLVGVTISGDLIEGNTVKADKLVIKGEDGLYYKLNIEGGSTVTEQLTKEMLQNGLDGNNIIANTITAEKISVDDLIAFDATIGGFNIGSNSIYSGVKSSINNTTRGIYLDTDGQVYFGDSNNYLKYYKFADNDWRLEVAAKNIIFGASGKDIEEAFEDVQGTIDGVQNNLDNLEIGGRNYIVKTDSFSSTKNGITVDYDGNVYHVYGTNTKTDADYGFVYFVDRTNVFEPGVVYTVSTTTPLPSGLYLGINTRNSIGNEVKAASNSYFYGDGSKTSNTFTCIQDTNGELRCFFGINADCGTVDVTFKIKLEKGNKATDWTPAPEDVDEDIDNVWEKADNAQTSIDNLEIGGRNLVTNSVNLSDFSIESSTYTTRTITDNYCIVNRLVNANSSSSHYGIYKDIPVTAGEEYTVSCTVKEITGRMRLGLGYDTFEWTGLGVWDLSVGRFSRTVTAPSIATFIRIYIAGNDGVNGGSVTVSNIKLEKGNKATDWTPAPEDIDSRTTVLEAASAKELVRNGFAEFTNDPKLTLGKTTSPWKVVVKNDGIFLQKSSNDVASLSKETSSEETTLRADNARLANVKFRSANGGGKLGIVAQSNGHVSLKEI